MLLTDPKTSPLTFYRFLGRLVGILTMGSLHFHLGQQQQQQQEQEKSRVDDDGTCVLEWLTTTLSWVCFGWFVIFLVGAMEEILVLTVIVPGSSNNTNKVVKSWIHVEILTNACWGRLVAMVQHKIHRWRYKDYGCFMDDDDDDDDDKVVRHDEDVDHHILATGSMYDFAVLYE
jgi:hypothetical protein